MNMPFSLEKEKRLTCIILIFYTLIQLQIFVPKGNPMRVAQMQNLVDGKIGKGKIKVIIDTIEKE